MLISIKIIGRRGYLKRFRKFLGISKLDLEVIYHFKKHGKFLEGEILAMCPLCKEDHRVLYFKCKCGDPFFCHLNKESNNYEKFPTGKVKSGNMFE